MLAAAAAAASPRGATLPRGSSSRAAVRGGGGGVGGRAPRAARTRGPARRASRAGPVTTRAVSIFDAARGEDEPSQSIPGSMGTDAATPPAATPSRPNPPNPTPPARRRPAGAPVVAPTVISSKAALLATAEDLADDVDAAEERLARRNGARTSRGGKEKDGIVGWTLEAVDRGLDSIERERPSTAQAAWKVASEAEKVAKNPTVQKGVKLTADAGIEVVKRAAPVIGKVAGNVGKFAAKSAFSAAVGGVFPKKKNDGGKSKEK